MPSYPAFIEEPARRVEVIHRTEVLVVGSGPGGLAAKAGRELAEVDMAAVQARLEGQGVRLR